MDGARERPRGRLGSREEKEGKKTSIRSCGCFRLGAFFSSKHAPFSSVTYDPRYSCRSVCSWLLIRTNLCPVFSARYSTRLVFPLLVGPWSRMGCLRSVAARANAPRRRRVPGVTTYRPLASGSPRAASPHSTQYCSTRTCVSFGGAGGGLNISWWVGRERGQTRKRRGARDGAGERKRRGITGRRRKRRRKRKRDEKRDATKLCGAALLARSGSASTFQRRAVARRIGMGADDGIYHPNQDRDEPTRDGPAGWRGGPAPE